VSLPCLLSLALFRCSCIGFPSYFFLFLLGAILFRGKERSFGFGFGFDFGLLARSAVLRTGCISAFSPLGLELAGTGWDGRRTSPPRAGWYTSPVLGSPNLPLPNLRLRLRSLTRGCVSQLRPGDVDVQAERGTEVRMGVDGTQA
jgi:hypothetical protein